MVLDCCLVWYVGRLQYLLGCAEYGGNKWEVCVVGVPWVMCRIIDWYIRCVYVVLEGKLLVVQRCWQSGNEG